ncbi:MAG: chemotaxis protein CheW [Nitrospinaceae bacterium]
MPLIHLSQVLKGTPREPDDNLLEAIIFSNEGRSVGVVVDHIIDIFEENIVIKSVVGRKGILGSAVVQGKVTDLLDVRSVIEETDPGFYSAESAGALTGAR